MEELCKSLASYNLRQLWAPNLEAQLIKQIRDYRATPRILSWDVVKSTIRDRLIDQSPCSIGESLISMVHSLHMLVTIWTNYFLSLIAITLMFSGILQQSEVMAIKVN